MGIKTVIHHQVPVSDLQRAVTWYVNCLGFEATFDDAGECGWWLHFSDLDGNRYFSAEDK